jgi:hypothetical protein
VILTPHSRLGVQIMNQSNASNPPVQSEPLCCGPEWHAAFPDEPGLSPEDEEWYVREVSRRYGDAAELKPGTLVDLAESIAGYLTGLGLEPDVRDGSIRFLLVGRLIQLSIEDIDARLEALAEESSQCRQVSDEERGMMAAGLPVG